MVAAKWHIHSILILYSEWGQVINSSALKYLCAPLLDSFDENGFQIDASVFFLVFGRKKESSKATSQKFCANMNAFFATVFFIAWTLIFFLSHSRFLYFHMFFSFPFYAFAYIHFLCASLFALGKNPCLFQIAMETHSLHEMPFSKVMCT